MARAICENNHVYTWRNKKGYRLADFPCPECGTKGRSVRDFMQANRLPIARIKTVLKIACMYCDKYMGEKDGEGIKGVTTSICRDCWKEHHPQWPYPEE